MSSETPDVVLLTAKIPPAKLAELVNRFFRDMVKYVVDVRRRRIAVGGEMHADAEAVLLADGSAQNDLWGANYFPGRGPESCIEYTSLINIRPAAGNRGMEVHDPAVLESIRAITFEILGRGEGLP